MQCVGSGRQEAYLIAASRHCFRLRWPISVLDPQIALALCVKRRVVSAVSVWRLARTAGASSHAEPCPGCCISTPAQCCTVTCAGIPNNLLVRPMRRRGACADLASSKPPTAEAGHLPWRSDRGREWVWSGGSREGARCQAVSHAFASSWSLVNCAHGLEKSLGLRHEYMTYWPVAASL